MNSSDSLLSPPPYAKNIFERVEGKKKGSRREIKQIDVKQKAITNLGLK